MRIRFVRESNVSMGGWDLQNRLCPLGEQKCDLGQIENSMFQEV
jgi:hypothetical protein